MTAPNFEISLTTIVSQGSEGTQGTPSIPTPGEGGQPGTGAPKGSLLNGMMPFLLIGLVLWFLIFAPEKKARKRRQEMLDSLKKGDKIVTTGGLHAEIAELRDNEVVLKAGDSRFVYTRSAIADLAAPKDANG